MKRVRWVVTILLLLAAGVIGLTNLPDEFRNAHGSLQRSVSIGVGLYAMLGLIGGVGLLLRKRWSVAVCAAFSLVIVYVASVASIAWMDADTPAGAKVSAFFGSLIATGLLGWFIVWAARADTRENLPRPTAPDHIPTP